MGSHVCLARGSLTGLATHQAAEGEAPGLGASFKSPGFGGKCLSRKSGTVPHEPQCPHLCKGDDEHPPALLACEGVPEQRLPLTSVNNRRGQGQAGGGVRGGNGESSPACTGVTSAPRAQTERKLLTVLSLYLCSQAPCTENQGPANRVETSRVEVCGIHCLGARGVGVGRGTAALCGGCRL